MRKPHILFVDDEPRVLEGLQRAVRRKREAWDMTFALGGKEALEALDRGPIDVLVTDMRMPGMDGGQVLAHFRSRSPDTARIVLSGYSEEEAVLRAVRPAHQYLSKPCEPRLLVAAVDRAVGLRETIDNSGVREMVGTIESLPALPETYRQLVDHLASPTASSRSVAEIVGRDLALRVQVMKVCNSSFFGLPQKIASLTSAINMLGLDLVRSLALLSGFFETFDGDETVLDELHRLQEASQKIGCVARSVCQAIGGTREETDLAASAGMLAHIGTLIIATRWTDGYRSILATRTADGGEVCAVERSVLGSDHCALGAYLLGLWGFPAEISETVAFHHRPGASPLVDGASRTVLAAVHIAQWAAAGTTAGEAAIRPWGGELDEPFLRAARLLAAAEDALRMVTECSGVEEGAT